MVAESSRYSAVCTDGDPLGLEYKSRDRAIYSGFATRVGEPVIECCTLGRML